MTILEGDIKLLASRVMDDVPEGGGGPTGNVIPYGGSNHIFSDITEADRAGGNVSIRQVHAAVMTSTAEQYMGANFILSMLPTDPNVSVTLAKCNLFARRTEIAAAIANYLIQGSEWSGYLLENHVVGQRNIQLFHRPGTPTPPIGRTLVLIYNENLPGQLIQYVRVTKVTTETRTFTYQASGSYIDFQGSVSQLDLSDALRYNFPGSPPDRSFGRNTTKTLIRDTTVADAAVYYGASPLTVAGAIGDSAIKVSSIYTQLVPNSRTETSALDQRPAATRSIVLATSPRQVEVAAAPHTQRIKVGQENRGFNYVFLLKPLPEPATITISWMALGTWYSLQDDGSGAFTGSGAGQIIYGTGSGSVTLPSLPDAGSSIIIQWGERVGFTNRSAQGAQVRPPEYCFVLEQDGYEPGSAVITWTSGGVTRTATANAAGKITGHAAGEIDAPSGTVFLRPAYMIDPGGQFSVAYQVSTQQTEILPAPTVDGGGFATLTLAQQPAAGSLSISWVAAREVSNTSGGTLASESSNKTADSSTVVQQVPRLAAEDKLSATGASGSGGTGVALWFNGSSGYPGSAGVEYVSALITTVRSNSSKSTLTRQSDQGGSLRRLDLNTITDDGVGGFIGGMGTVAYASKTVSLRMVSFDTSTTSYKADHESATEFDNAAGGSGTSSSGGSSQRGGEYGTTAVGAQILAGSSVVARYKVGTTSPTSQTMSFTPPDVVIDLCPYTTDRIVPGSVRFTWMGEVYEDFEGVIYRGRSSTTTGFASGTIDYGAGLARMTDWVVSGSPSNFVLNSLWTQKGAWRTASIFMRTQAAPIKPTGFVMTLLDVQGNALTATGDLSGNLIGPHMLGYFDYQYGVAELQFGDFVLDSSLTAAQKAEWWYNAADVGAVEPGKIWRPWPVDPTTLRYNSVAYFYLPLDADIVGLDPVRLPPDGRVPIYRVGSYVVMGHTGVVPAATYANGQTINCARERLSRVYLVGADGQLIRTGYTPDLDAGTVAVTDITGWVQPVTVKHRIEQMARVADVQIDGTLKLTKQLAHVFPVGSVVSSAIMAGNLRARALPVFDQQTWDGVTWADATVGNPAPATYNDGAFPVVVTNAGAVTERFALRVLTGGTDVEVIGEHVGNLGTFSRNTAIAPINPISGAPYFTLAAAGWGAGWVPGNTLFLPTVGTYYPMAVIRATQPSEGIGTDYAFELTERGDIDRAPTTPVI